GLFFIKRSMGRGTIGESSMKDEIFKQAIEDNYRLWNENKIDDLLALFDKMGPEGFTIEYVGQEPVEGKKAIADMWAQYGGKSPAKPQLVLVNGNEGAAYVLNYVQTDKGEMVLPSLETYKVEDGKLTIRYYHNIPE